MKVLFSNRFAALEYENYFSLTKIGKNFQRVSLSMQYPRDELLSRKQTYL